MKPSLVFRALLLLILTLSQNAECRPIKAPRDFGSTSIKNEEERELVNAPDSEESFSFQDPKKAEFQDMTAEGSSSGEELEDTQTAADAQKSKKRKSTGRVNVEIIDRPKELKVFVNRSPSSTKKSATKEGKKGWEKVQLEMLKEGKKKSVDEEDLDAMFAAESEKYNKEDSDDDDEFDDSNEADGSGDDASMDFVNSPAMSRDDSHHKTLNRFRHPHHHHQRKRPESSYTGFGILWSLVVIALVFLVIAVVFLHRCCTRGKMQEDVELESIKVEDNRDAIKEARMKVGKRKSMENRKVLRKQSMDQGATTVGEELAIACSIISPSMETRRRNSEALHTRASVRAATSRRNSTFEEDLVIACAEFEQAPTKFAQLVSQAGDEKDNEARKGKKKTEEKSVDADTAADVDFE